MQSRHHLIAPTAKKNLEKLISPARRHGSSSQNRLRDQQSPHTVHIDAEPLQPHIPRGRARDDAHAQGEKKSTTSHAPTRTQLSFSHPFQHFGVGSIPWSPLARGALTRPLGELSIRADNDTCVKKKHTILFQGFEFIFLILICQPRAAGTTIILKNPATKKSSSGERMAFILIYTITHNVTPSFPAG